MNPSAARFSPPRRPAAAARRRFLRLRTTALLLLPLLGACSTPSSTQPRPSGTNSTPLAARTPVSVDLKSPFRALKKGLNAAEVRSLLGEPAEVKTAQSAGITSEIWIYRASTPGPVRQVPAEMQDVPVVDPITGVMRMTKEPVYRIEHTRINESTELLLIKGLLVEWKQLRTVDRTID